MNPKRISYLILVILFLFADRIYMQEVPALTTDRPDVTESALVVPINSFQIETGFVFQKQKYVEQAIEYENENLIVASSLFRYGINQNFEFRFGGEYFLGKTTADYSKSTVQGLSGIFIGSKFQFISGGYIFNNVSVILEINLPFGNEKLRPDKFEPGITLVLDKSLFESINLGFNLGARNISASDSYELYYSLSAGIPLDNRWTTFVEYFGKSELKFSSESNVHFGFSYLQKQNIQIDFSMGFLIFNEDTDYFGQVGFSVRLPE